VFHIIFFQDYRHIGCFKDAWDRAIPSLHTAFKKEIGAVKSCADLSKKKGYTVFSVEFGGECYSGPNAEQTYDKYGRASNCKDGVGGSWAADVYTFLGTIN
jgi:hypothetical protein